MTPAETIADQEASHRRELRKLSDLAFAFLNATDSDCRAAENLLDDSIDLLFESGVLSTLAVQNRLSCNSRGTVNL